MFCSRAARAPAPRPGRAVSRSITVIFGLWPSSRKAWAIAIASSTPPTPPPMTAISGGVPWATRARKVVQSCA